MITTYGDISPRTAAFAVASLLKRALPHLVIEKFGQAYPIPSKSSTTAKFRRYESLAAALTPLTEGVTPPGSSLTVSDVTATLVQYGDFVPISDVIADTHEDPVFAEAQQIISEQAALTVETIRFNILKAGTNVFYANGTARTDVNTELTLNLQRKVTRGFKRQNGRMITNIIKSTPAFDTESTEAGYIGLAHPDLESGVRGLAGFINVKDYGTITPYDNEIGAVEDCRYLRSTVFDSFADGGGAKGTTISAAGVKSDVYPVIYLSANAYGLVPLKGKDSIVPIVMNPNTPRGGDPLGQRGSVGWKLMTTAVILNQLFMARAEVAVEEL